ncbi:hypothetical protein CBL_00287 [Carabus blaptoides fortunei]
MPQCLLQTKWHATSTIHAASGGDAPKQSGQVGQMEFNCGIPTIARTILSPWTSCGQDASHIRSASRWNVTRSFRSSQLLNFILQIVVSLLQQRVILDCYYRYCFPCQIDRKRSNISVKVSHLSPSDVCQIFYGVTDGRISA